MADYITKIRTESGDKRIDYNALANLPEAPTIESIGAAPINHKHAKSDISDFPTSLPANGGDADTVDGKHASDFALASDVESISLESFGVTATEEELNYVKGVTSEIQAQLNEKALKDHTHKASEIDAAASNHTHKASEVGAKASGSVESITTGGTGSSNGATGLKNLFAAGTTILSSYQYGDKLPSKAPAGALFFKKVKVSS